MRGIERLFRGRRGAVEGQKGGSRREVDGWFRGIRGVIYGQPLRGAVEV